MPPIKKMGLPFIGNTQAMRLTQIESKFDTATIIVRKLMCEMIQMKQNPEEECCDCGQERAPYSAKFKRRILDTAHSSYKMLKAIDVDLTRMLNAREPPSKARTLKEYIGHLWGEVQSLVFMLDSFKCSHPIVRSKSEPDSHDSSEVTGTTIKRNVGDVEASEPKRPRPMRDAVNCPRNNASHVRFDMSQ